MRLKDYMSEEYDNDGWVLVDTVKRKVLKYSEKGKPKMTSSKGQELMRVSYAKKMGYITEMMNKKQLKFIADKVAQDEKDKKSGKKPKKDTRPPKWKG